MDRSDMEQECGAGHGFGRAAGSGCSNSSGYGDLDIASGGCDEDGGSFAFGRAPGEGEALDGSADYGEAFSEGLGIKSIDGRPVCAIDGILMVVDTVQGDIIAGRRLNIDMSLEPCYIVRLDGISAFARTLEDAYLHLAEAFEDRA